MAKEIEQKFLVTAEGWREAAVERKELRQFYLAAGEDRSMRVRVRDGQKATLTLKFGGAGRVRDEFEYELPLADALEMQAFALGAPIIKTRHMVPHGGHVWEVDEFAGALSGLVMAEVESVDMVPADQRPGWVGREVTDEAGFYNLALALNGLPEGVA
ncbi:CYTH domain-containing protein [Chelativorans sp. ZYF759]|uniref:CYTH domain-containing protein n=1 Tax=Chelativorans sp. ZYF759 TaxID=2692213 RepID=UPI00145EBDF6|nr:CYTH domain-containing protein [Chelativorans sp. ZYF759]NMG40955.1 CYTH domain-containing protein [Chelativorans sp. ZYF759]